MILDLNYIKENITNDYIEVIGDDEQVYKKLIPVPYRWTHGATDNHLGDGLVIYSLIQFLRAKICVCLGSGGGFIPRIMTQARLDLYDSGIFEGKKEFNWGDIGSTFLVDAANGVGGKINYLDEDSFFRSRFFPRFINDTTKNAYFNFFTKEDIKIDYLHIDADHSYEDVKQDFELYSNLLSDNGLISIHDTDSRYENNYIVSKDLQEQNQYQSFTEGPSKFNKESIRGWQKLNLFNEGNLQGKPSSTGLTLYRHA